MNYYDCIIIGAGPGGLQAALHLGRYNRKVLLIERGGGRTTQAKHMVNYLGLMETSGPNLIATGLKQIQHFGVDYIQSSVTRLEKEGLFQVHTKDDIFQSRFVLASTGATDHHPPLKNMNRFFCNGYFTCVTCDGHHATDKRLLVMGNSLNCVRLALAMKQMYTTNISVLLVDYTPPPDYSEALMEEDIPVVTSAPVALLGDKNLEGVELEDGRVLHCEVIMSSFGWSLNDTYLEGLSLKRDRNDFKIVTNSANESSLPGLFVVGALQPGHSQAIIAAGQGAVSAIHINQQLLEI